jgi:hypothetical protein
VRLIGARRIALGNAIEEECDMASKVSGSRVRLVVWFLLLVVVSVVWFVRAHPRAWGGLASVPQAKVSELLTAVDPLVVYHRQAVSEDRNAWPLIMDAVKLIPGKRGTGSAAYLSDADRVRQRGASVPAAEAKARDAAWNPALEKVSQALRLPACQVPPVSGDVSYDYLPPIRGIGKALAGRAQDELDAGNPDAAADDLLLCHRLGIALRGSEGVAEDHYVAGVSVCGMADSFIQWNVTDPHWRVQDLRKLLLAWGSASRNAKDLETQLQVEFTCVFLPRLASLSSMRGWWNCTIDPQDIQACADVDHALDQVFMGHRNPFDRLQTAKEASGIVADCIRDLSLPWTQQKSTDEQILAWEAGWPRYFSDIVGPAGEHERKALARFLHNVDNPLGKRFTVDWGGVYDAVPAMYFRDTVHWESTRLILACRIYKLEHGGALPASLEALVGPGYLDSMPVDPYSGAPFKYDRGRGRIWSVGLNGVDDGGRDAPGGSANGKDLVWLVDPPVPSRSKPPAAAPPMPGNAAPPSLMRRPPGAASR